MSQTASQLPKPQEIAVSVILVIIIQTFEYNYRVAALLLFVPVHMDLARILITIVTPFLFI